MLHWAVVGVAIAIGLAIGAALASYVIQAGEAVLHFVLDSAGTLIGDVLTGLWKELPVVGSFAPIGLIWSIWSIWHHWDTWAPAALLFIRMTLPWFLFYLFAPSYRDREDLGGLILWRPIVLAFLPLFGCFFYYSTMLKPEPEIEHTLPFYITPVIFWLGVGSSIGKGLAWFLVECLDYYWWSRQSSAFSSASNRSGTKRWNDCTGGAAG